ncbi:MULTISPECIES: diguanylate cyclase domain-containing protein [Giesbergeria]|uniref:Diguanylate cyclase domain-containing protein n=1 Tax=Giesbergeria sinuosa TaxID=80883 RepID=A0ABV9QHH4_9BURK
MLPHCLQTLGLWLLISPLLLFISVSARAQDRVTLQLKWEHAFQFAGYYAALEQGYYRDAGFEVTLAAGKPGVDVVGQVVSGKAEFGVGTSSLLLARAAGKPVVVLAAIFQHSPLVLIARGNAPGQSVHDLAGKRVMLEPQSEELQAYLRQSGLAPSEYAKLPHSFQVQDLIDGKVDAISAYLSNEVFLLRQAGVPHQIYTPRSVGIDFYGDNLFTSDRLLREQPERVAAFVAASLRGWRYALDHPETINAWIRQTYPGLHTPEFLAFEAEQTRALVRADLVELGYMHPGRWRYIADTYASLGLLPAGIPLEGFLYQPQDGRGTHLPYEWIVGAVLVMGLGGGMTLYVWRTNRRLWGVLQQSRCQAQREQARSQVLEMLAHDAPLNDILYAIVRSVEAERPAMLCSILLLTPDGMHLTNGASPSLPDFYLAAIEGLTIGPAVGSCGTAAWGAHRVVVEDIQSHPYWTPYRALAERAGLRACWSQPVCAANGQVLGTFGMYFDTVQAPGAEEIALIEAVAHLAAIAIERARSQEALRISEERHRLLADHASDVIWTMNLEGRFTYVSPSVEKLRGYTVAEVMAQGIDEALTAESAVAAKAALHAAIEAVMHGQSFPELRQELEQPCKDGSTVWTEVTTSGIYSPSGEFIGILGVTRDISERKRNEQRIAYMARHDPLTDLPNRMLLEDRLRQALLASRRHHHQLAVMFLDLDKFKPVNDQYGHAVGDLLLRVAAQRMQTQVRAADTVARIGGDEFVVLLPIVQSTAAALQVAEKIRVALSQPFDLQGVVVSISASIGVALCPDHGGSDVELLRHADAAMYQAKQQNASGVALFTV